MMAMILALLIGLIIGSFLNVVIYRLPVMMESEYNRMARLQLGMEVEEEPVFNLMTPRSRCGSCGAAVRAWQNIPVISWLLLRGRCGSCSAKIAVRYPLVELLTGLLFAAMAWQYGETYITIGACLFTAYVVALTFIDADTQLLPDSLTIPLVWLGLLFNLMTGFVPLQSAVIGAMAGYMGLWSIYWLFKLLTGKEGMGYGDFKMLAAVGAWLGVFMLPVVVLAAAIVGIVAALLKRLSKGQPMAFGPCLAVAAWFVFLFREHVGAAVNWWLHASGF